MPTAATERITPGPWLILAAWTVPALLATLETVAFAGMGGHPIAVWRAFASEAAGWYTWAAFTRVIMGTAQRYPIERPLKWRALGAHLLLYAVVAASTALVWTIVGFWLRPNPRSFFLTWEGWFLSGLPFTILAYAAVVGITYTIAHRNRLRVNERNEALLAKQLAEAQLAALRMQLQPHFLFNTLNAIMALMRTGDAAPAISALGLLSDLLRTALDLSTTTYVTLGAEAGFIRRYLDIEQLRFHDRLRVTFAIPPDLLDALVPTFVLQPFVENAVRHGILPRRSGGNIAVEARADGSTLSLTVRDDGVGLSTASADAPAGVGIANARATLLQLYGAEGSLQVGAGATGGVLVEIRLPIHRARAEHPEPPQLTVP